MTAKKNTSDWQTFHSNVIHPLEIPLYLLESGFRTLQKLPEVLFFVYLYWWKSHIFAVFRRQKIGLPETFVKFWNHFLIVIGVFQDDAWHWNEMFVNPKYFFQPSYIFWWFSPCNPLTKCKKVNLQRKESSNQKMQENKPVLEFKSTEDKLYQNMWIKLFWFYPPLQCALVHR